MSGVIRMFILGKKQEILFFIISIIIIWKIMEYSKIKTTPIILMSSYNQTIKMLYGKDILIINETDFNINMKTAEERMSKIPVEFGGRIKPKKENKYKVAVIVPIKDNFDLIPKFLEHHHSILYTQQIQYKIIFSVQADSSPYNRAKLFNVGFTVLLQFEYFDCFIFHEIEYFLLNPKLIYECSTAPIQYVASIQNNIHISEDFIGGVIAISITQFINLNGFSNCYGRNQLEYIDMDQRIKKSRYKLIRKSELDGVFYYHQNKNINKVLNAPEKSVERMKKGYNIYEDGLIDIKFERLSGMETYYYDNITVNIENIPGCNRY